MSRCRQKPISIGFPVRAVLHRNEGLWRRIFADVFVDNVQFVSVRRYVVYEIPRLPRLRRRDNKNSRVAPRIGGVTKTLKIRKICVKWPRRAHA